MYNHYAAGGYLHQKRSRKIMDDYHNIPIRTAVAAELFAQLPVASQDALIALIKSLLSGQ